MSFVSNFGPPLAFIFICMTVVRLFALSSSKRKKSIHSTRRWLFTSALIGFFIAVVLGCVAWRMDNDFVVSHSYWIWPFCLGLIALNDHPAISTAMTVLLIAAIENAFVYLLLASVVALAFRSTRRDGASEATPLSSTDR